MASAPKLHQGLTLSSIFWGLSVLQHNELRGMQLSDYETANAWFDSQELHEFRELALQRVGTNIGGRLIECYNGPSCFFDT